ncbi:MAG: rhomboid family intramembrane serine protease [Alistipes sp.]|nr:rhomboid family intramembrane serine protease [Alistipes sp.]
MNSYGVRQTTPPVVMNLLIANVVVYLATSLLDKVTIYEYFSLFPVGSPFFHWWQPLTYMFMHGGFSHLFFNMFALWMFGRDLEWELGWKRFLAYYIICGVGAAVVQLGMAEIDLLRLPDYSPRYWEYLYTPTVGASGAIFGLLLAFGMLHPNAIIMLIFPPIPMKAKWFVVIYGAVELLFGVSGRMDNVAHFAHLGGMFWGWLLLLWWRYQDRKRGNYYL